MPRQPYSAFRCPANGEPLSLQTTPADASGAAGSAFLVSSAGHHYPIIDGIADLSYPVTLGSSDRHNREHYDSGAREAYDNFVDWLFAAFGEDEHHLRSSLIDRLDIDAGSTVLEIACGTGHDTLLLRERLTHGALYAQDLSMAMVRVCHQRLTETAAAPATGDDESNACHVELFCGNGAYLPFADGFFDAVLHVGGINEFSDKARALQEMARVTRVGGKVVVADESMAPWLRDSDYARILTHSNPLLAHQPPLELLPANASEVQQSWVLGNAYYVIDFRVASGPPEVDLDLPHKGRRGGTLRTRWYGRLEGVTPATKALAEQAAAHLGLSMHQWLDESVRRQAEQVVAAQPEPVIPATADAAPVDTTPRLINFEPEQWLRQTGHLRYSEASPGGEWYEDVLYLPGHDCLYHADGSRIEASCLRRGADKGEIRSQCCFPRVVPPTEPARVDGSTLYVGAMHHHYGHFLLEGSARLWAAIEQPDLPLLCFGEAHASAAGIRSTLLDTVPGLRQRLVSHKRACLLKQVYIPNPSFVIRCEAYGLHKQLPERLAAQLGADSQQRSGQPLYLSRLGLHPSLQRQTAGEQRLVQILEAAGVAMVQPEQLSLAEQIRLINRHETVIGVIGSALHGLLFDLSDHPQLVCLAEKDRINGNYPLVDRIKQATSSYIGCVSRDATPDRPIYYQHSTLDVDAAIDGLRELGIINHSHNRNARQ